MYSQTVAAPAAAKLQGKRAAMVTFSPYPGDPRPRRAVDALLKEGVSVDLICLAHDGAPKREAIGGLRILRVPIKHRRGGTLTYAYNYSAFLVIAMVVLAARTLRRRYHLVHVHNMPDVLVLSGLVPRALGAKVILDMHDPMPELMTTIFHLDKRALSVRTMLKLERWSMARADAVIAVNIACKRMFAARSCRPEKVAVVMNSPDGEIFPLRPPRVRVSGGNNRSGRFVIMYHGSLVERNGLDLAVDALARVKKIFPGAELRICGTQTPFLTRMLEDAKSRGLQDSIHYLGPKRLEDLVGAIEDCDVGVIPNHRSEFTEINTPTRIFEYLTMGKPVIAPRTPGIEDYFGPEALVFFESGDSADLARKIEEVASQPVKAAETARRGQEVFLAHTWTQERNTLVNLVSTLLVGESRN
jgi:glycosyltransferase involved in cell wall biosynthesis